MRKTFFLLIVVIFQLLGCTHEDTLVNGESQQLSGTWLFTENGFSNGAEYITNPVAPFPSQKIEFKTDSTIASTVKGWENYRFYRVSDDTIYGEKVITLYLHDPNVNKGNEGLGYNYVIDKNEHSLKMYFRWCIEGCHVGFKRLD